MADTNNIERIDTIHKHLLGRFFGADTKKDERINAIHRHLLVVENRLECLIAGDYIQECDALDILRVNLAATVSLSSPKD